MLENWLGSCRGLINIVILLDISTTEHGLINTLMQNTFYIIFLCDLKNTFNSVLKRENLVQFWWLVNSQTQIDVWRIGTFNQIAVLTPPPLHSQLKQPASSFSFVRILTSTWYIVLVCAGVPHYTVGGSIIQHSYPVSTKYLYSICIKWNEINWARTTSRGWCDEWMRWHCPSDKCFETRALAVCDRARYFLVTEVPHNIEYSRVSGEETFLFLWKP